jgi:hypothetical protein
MKINQTEFKSCFQPRSIKIKRSHRWVRNWETMIIKCHCW